MINDFVSKNLNNPKLLGDLQRKLIVVSSDLEKNGIGHGDLQCGNIIITQGSSDFNVRLIDYDGMYVPNMPFSRSIERGRSEFQHPRRTFSNFDHKIDRFSFWVFITALEAIKIDRTLWKEVMQGGFNTLDNFLFTIQDFKNPYQSPLFNRLSELKSPSLNYYIKHLIANCIGPVSSVSPPSLHKNETKSKSQPGNASTNSQPTNAFKVRCSSTTASVLSSSLKKLGETPLDLDKGEFDGKVIVVSNGKKSKGILLTKDKTVIDVHFI